MVKVLLVFMFIALVRFGPYALRTMLGASAVRERLKNARLESLSLRSSYWKRTRSELYFDFKARTPEGAIVTGHALHGRKGNVALFFDGEDPGVADLQRIAHGEHPTIEADEGLDLESRIRFETNQRLERLQGDREAFLQSDVNGDGTVDDTEWALTRARVEAEVREEFVTGVPTPRASRVVIKPQSEPAEAEAEVVSDAEGHW